jgi:hypothetical protein
LIEEAQRANEYIDNLQNSTENVKSNPGNFNGVDYETYNNLISEYGRKELQSIILL